MNIHILALIFFAISMLNGLLSFLAVPFFRTQGEARLYGWMACNLLYSVGSAIFAFNIATSDTALPFDISYGGILIPQLMRFTSFIGLILFLRSFSPKSLYQASAGKILFTISILCATSALVIYPHIPSVYKEVGGGMLWVFLALIWLIYELDLIRKSAQYHDSYSIRLLFIFGYTLLALQLLLVLANVIVYLNMLPFFEFSIADYQSVNVALRLVISLISPVIFILVFIFWVENQSDLAIQSKSHALRVSALLDEKDILINNLANANSLVESGALAAGLAHELNQHLARIQLNAEQAISMINSGNKDTDLIQSLEHIAKANQEAANLIRSLKKIFRNPLDKKNPIGLDQVVLDVTGLYKDRLKKSRIKLDLNLRTTKEVFVTDSFIRQVLSNLISNAIESLDTTTQPNKIILIDLSESFEDVKLEVFDNGPGIHPGKQVTLFEMFKTTKSNGSGIGLWLSKHLVEAEGGEIYAHSPSTGGAIFTVKIPV